MKNRLNKKIKKYLILNHNLMSIIYYNKKVKLKKKIVKKLNLQMMP